MSSDNHNFAAILNQEIATALANTDYIVAMINMKAKEHALDPIRSDLLRELLQEIELVMTPASSEELH